MFRVGEGTLGYMAARALRRPGTQKLEAELTIRAGDVVWDLNGRAARAYTDMPKTPQGDGPPSRRPTPSLERK